MRDRLDALRWRTKYLVGLATKDESRKGRAAQVSKWAHQNSREYRQRQVDLEEMQAPTTVVNKLIRMTQSPSAARRARDAREARSQRSSRARPRQGRGLERGTPGSELERYDSAGDSLRTSVGEETWVRVRVRVRVGVSVSVKVKG